MENNVQTIVINGRAANVQFVPNDGDGYYRATIGSFYRGIGDTPEEAADSAYSDYNSSMRGF